MPNYKIEERRRVQLIFQVGESGRASTRKNYRFQTVGDGDQRYYLLFNDENNVVDIVQAEPEDEGEGAAETKASDQTLQSITEDPIILSTETHPIIAQKKADSSHYEFYKIFKRFGKQATRQLTPSVENPPVNWTGPEQHCKNNSDIQSHVAQHAPDSLTTQLGLLGIDRTQQNILFSVYAHEGSFAIKATKESTDYCFLRDKTTGLFTLMDDSPEDKNLLFSSYTINPDNLSWPVDLETDPASIGQREALITFYSTLVEQVSATTHHVAALQEKEAFITRNPRFGHTPGASTHTSLGTLAAETAGRLLTSTTGIEARTTEQQKFDDLCGACHQHTPYNLSAHDETTWLEEHTERNKTHPDREVLLREILSDSLLSLLDKKQLCDKINEKLMDASDEEVSLSYARPYVNGAMSNDFAMVSIKLSDPRQPYYYVISNKTARQYDSLDSGRVFNGGSLVMLASTDGVSANLYCFGDDGWKKVQQFPHQRDAGLGSVVDDFQTCKALFERYHQENDKIVQAQTPISLDTLEQHFQYSADYVRTEDSRFVVIINRSDPTDHIILERTRDDYFINEEMRYENNHVITPGNPGDEDARVPCYFPGRHEQTHADDEALLEERVDELSGEKSKQHSSRNAAQHLIDYVNKLQANTLTPGDKQQLQSQLQGATRQIQRDIFAALGHHNEPTARELKSNPLLAQLCTQRHALKQCIAHLDSLSVNLAALPTAASSPAPTQQQRTDALRRMTTPLDQPQGQQNKATQSHVTDGETTFRITTEKQEPPAQKGQPAPTPRSMVTRADGQSFTRAEEKAAESCTGIVYNRLNALESISSDQGGSNPLAYLLACYTGKTYTFNNPSQHHITRGEIGKVIDDPSEVTTPGRMAWLFQRPASSPDTVQGALARIILAEEERTDALTGFTNALRGAVARFEQRRLGGYTQPFTIADLGNAISAAKKAQSLRPQTGP